MAVTFTTSFEYAQTCAPQELAALFNGGTYTSKKFKETTIYAGQIGVNRYRDNGANKVSTACKLVNIKMSGECRAYVSAFWSNAHVTFDAQGGIYLNGQFAGLSSWVNFGKKYCDSTSWSDFNITLDTPTQFEPNTYFYVNLRFEGHNYVVERTAQLRNIKLSYTRTRACYITFKGDGITETTTMYDYGTVPSFGSTPTRNGYTFKGWNNGTTTYTGTLPTAYETDVTYTAVWEPIIFTRTWNFDGGTYNGKSSLSESISASAASTSLAQFKPIKQGYEFVGWDDGGYITQDGFKGYTSEHNSDWQVSINSDYSTKYKLNASGFTANTWRNIRFGNYDVTTSSNITVKGWIRLISTPVSLNFYHGDKSNDYTNNKKQLTPSNADGKWQYFSITRDVYTEATSTGCFEIFTGNLVNTEGTIEFDLREVQIIDNNTGAELLPLKTGQLSSNITIKALYRTAAYVTYDSIFSFAKWKSDGISASNATVSNITNTGFTLTSNAGVAEGVVYSPFFSVEYGKSYKIDIDITGINWDVYIFFCDKDGNWVDFADSTNRFSYGGSGVTSRIFTAPNKSSVVKAQIRVDANGASNTVSFANFRIYPAAYEYMSDSVPAAERTDIGAWSFPTPIRDGYEIIGWNSKPDGKGEAYTTDSAFPCEDITLYSQWKRISMYLGNHNKLELYLGRISSKQVYLGNTIIYG